MFLFKNTLIQMPDHSVVCKHTLPFICHILSFFWTHIVLFLNTYCPVFWTHIYCFWAHIACCLFLNTYCPCTLLYCLWMHGMSSEHTVYSCCTILTKSGAYLVSYPFVCYWQIFCFERNVWHKGNGIWYTIEHEPLLLLFPRFPSILIFVDQEYIQRMWSLSKYKQG